MSTVFRHIRIAGRVQGVGFRASLRAEAEARGVTGWVRNRTDGSVEAMLSGSERAVGALIEWCRQGPPAARVSNVLVDEHEPATLPERFEERPTL